MADMYASVEPKLQATLDKMPPSVKNAFQQILGGGSKAPEKIQWGVTMIIRWSKGPGQIKLSPTYQQCCTFQKKKY